MKLILLLFAVLAANAQTTAIRDDQALFNNSWNFRYSVDSVNGSDSNDGNSPWRPFQTLTKLVVQPINDNYSIGFARGSYWRGDVQIAKDYLGFYAFGNPTTSRPIIDGAEPCASWTKTAGLTNTYQCSVTFTNDNGGTIDVINAWENGLYLTRKTSSAAVDAAAGSYFVSSTTVSPATLYVYPTAGGSPASNGKTYEYASHFHQLASPAMHGTKLAQGWKIRSVHVTRNIDNNGAIVCGRLCGMYDVVADFGSKHNVFCSDGCLLQDSTLSDGYDTVGGSILLAVNEDSPVGIGITIRRSTFSAPTSNTLQGGVGSIISHNNVSGSFGTATLDTVTSNIHAGNSIAFGGADKLNVIGGIFAGQFLTSGITTFSNATVLNDTASTAISLAAGGSLSITNTALTTSSSAVVFAANAAGAFTNSTFTETGSGQSLFFDASDAGIVISASGNTYGSNAAQTYSVYNLPASASVTSDSNTWNNTNSLTMYDYQYTSGNDLHSTPNINAVTLARWNLASAYVSGSNIPDLDGFGYNLTFPGSTSNPTSQTAGVLFASGKYLGGPSLTGYSSTTGATATVVLKWTGTAGGMTASTLPLDYLGVIRFQGGVTASKIKPLLGQFSSSGTTSTTSIDDGGWHAVTIMDNGDRAYTWVDGVQQGTFTGSMTASPITPSSNTIVVGASSGHANNWTGQIAYVEYDKGQMAPSQITAFYASLKSSLAAQGVTLP